MSSIVALPPSGVGGATGTSQAKAVLHGLASKAATSVADLIFILDFLVLIGQMLAFLSRRRHGSLLSASGRYRDSFYTNERGVNKPSMSHLFTTFI
jgi:hypothetical protein